MKLLQDGENSFSVMELENWLLSVWCFVWRGEQRLCGVWWAGLPGGAPSQRFQSCIPTPSPSLRERKLPTAFYAGKGRKPF